MAANPPCPWAVDATSAPPANITSASSRCMILNESPMEWALVVQGWGGGWNWDPWRRVRMKRSGSQVDDGGRNEKGRDAVWGLLQARIRGSRSITSKPADTAANTTRRVAAFWGIGLRADLERGQIPERHWLMPNWMKRPYLLISFRSMNRVGRSP